MKILLYLGRCDEYLGYKKFKGKKQEKEIDDHLEAIESLMNANIEDILPLRKRLKLLGKEEYFPFAGAVTSFGIIDTENPEEDI